MRSVRPILAGAVGPAVMRRLVGWGGSWLNLWLSRMEAWRLRREGAARFKQINATIQRHGQRVESLVRRSDPQWLSVLVAAHGAARHVAECLESIVTQALPPELSVEVIVGVDGCPETFQAIGRYLDQASEDRRKRIRVLNFAKNYGPYVMQNSLLYVSRGAHVHVVGADDVLVPNAILRIWEFLKECRACTSAYVLRPMGFLCDERLERIPGREAHQLKGALIFSKNALDQLGGFAPWLCAADADFLRRAEARSIPVYSLPAVTYLYRQHGTQMTRGLKTGMRSAIRARYWRLTQKRLAANALRETPVVAMGDPLNALNIQVGAPP